MHLSKDGASIPIQGRGTRDWSHPLALAHINTKQLAVMCITPELKLKVDISIHLLSDKVGYVMPQQRGHD